MQMRLVVAILTTFLWLASAAHAYELYAVTGLSPPVPIPTELYTVDIAGGGVAPYTPPLPPLITSMQGLAAYNSEIYGFDTVNSLHRLVSPLGPGLALPLGGPLGMYYGMAFNSYGDLFLAGNTTTGSILHTVDPMTGAVLSSKNFGSDIGPITGLSFSTSNTSVGGSPVAAGDLVATNGNEIFKLNTTGPLIAPEPLAPSIIGPIQSLAFGPDGRLFAGGDGGIFEIPSDPSAPILVAGLSPAVTGLTAMQAPIATPEPSTFILFGIALIGLYVIRRHLFS